MLLVRLVLDFSSIREYALLSPILRCEYRYRLTVLFPRHIVSAASTALEQKRRMHVTHACHRMHVSIPETLEK